MDDFKSLYQQEPVVTEEYKIAFKEWCLYFYFTERYDRRLGHVISERGNAIVMPWYQKRSNKHAHKLRVSMFETFRELGVSRDTIQSAKIEACRLSFETLAEYVYQEVDSR